MGKRSNKLSSGSIIDEGIEKYVEQFIQMPYVNYKDKYYNDFMRNQEKLIPRLQWNKDKLENYSIDCQIKCVKAKTFDDEGLYYDVEEVKRLERLKIPVARNEPQVIDYIAMKSWESIKRSEILEFYGVKEFNRCYMLNISPNWKGKNQEKMIPFLVRTMMDFYKDFGRWSKMKYVIECGKNGDFIHVHAVFEINKIKFKGTMTAIKKGNILTNFRNCWDRNAKEFESTKGYIGLVKGKHSLNGILIMNEEILSDKLDYLIEEKKSKGHQNAKHPICPYLVDLWRDDED